MSIFKKIHSYFFSPSSKGDGQHESCFSESETDSEFSSEITSGSFQTAELEELKKDLEVIFRPCMAPEVEKNVGPVEASARRVPSGNAGGRKVPSGNVGGGEVLSGVVSGRKVPSGNAGGRKVPSGDVGGDQAPFREVDEYKSPSQEAGSAKVIFGEAVIPSEEDVKKPIFWNENSTEAPSGEAMVPSEEKGDKKFFFWNASSKKAPSGVAVVPSEDKGDKKPTFWNSSSEMAPSGQVAPAGEVGNSNTLFAEAGADKALPESEGSDQLLCEVAGATKTSMVGSNDAPSENVNIIPKALSAEVGYKKGLFGEVINNNVPSVVCDFQAPPWEEGNTNAISNEASADEAPSGQTSTNNAPYGTADSTEGPSEEEPKSKALSEVVGSTKVPLDEEGSNKAPSQSIMTQNSSGTIVGLVGSIKSFFTKKSESDNNDNETALPISIPERVDNNAKKESDKNETKGKNAATKVEENKGTTAEKVFKDVSSQTETPPNDSNE